LQHFRFSGFNVDYFSLPGQNRENNRTTFDLSMTRSNYQPFAPAAAFSFDHRFSPSAGY